MQGREYYSYYGTYRDPTTKFAIEESKIITYKRDFFLIVFLTKWRLEKTVPLNADTKVIESRSQSDGKGYLELKQGGEEHQYWVFEDAHDFLSRVDAHLRRAASR